MHKSFDDVLIVPKFSTIRSRKDVSVVTTVGNEAFSLGVISSNMDTVTGPDMAKAMINYGAGACLHRFCSIEDNVKMFQESFVGPARPWVSIGLGEKEFERAEALIAAGATTILIDVAHGAHIGVVEQYDRLRNKYGYNIKVIVGNFATRQSIDDFNYRITSKGRPDSFKAGVGGGSACLTRVVTGVGVPTFSSIVDCARSGVSIIADGGIRNSGDFAKALAAGADAVMLGRMLAGTTESASISLQFDNMVDMKTKLGWTPGSYEEFLYKYENKKFKKYRGSASAESYEAQGKTAEWRAAEGDSFLIPYVGPVSNVIQTLEGGLRSAMSYVNATNLEEFRRNVEFIDITTNALRENGSHGKDNK